MNRSIKFCDILLLKRRILLVSGLAIGLLIPQIAVAASSGVSADFSGGAIKLGKNSAACDGTTEGQVSYDSSTGTLSYCDGASWTAMGEVQLRTQATLTTCDTSHKGVMRFNTTGTAGSASSSAPAVASFSTNATSGGAVSVTQPPSTASGDLLIMTISSDNTATWSWPSGFSDLGAGLVNFGGSIDGQTMGIAWKIATGSEPSTYDVTISGGSKYFSASVMRITGAASSSPIGTYNYNTTASGAASPATVTSPSITPSTDHNLILWIAGADSNSSGSYSYTVPSGMTAEVGPANDGTWSSHEIASLAQTTAAATGALSGTASRSTYNVAYAAFSVAIKPAVSGTAQSSTYVEVCDGSNWAVIGPGP